MRELRKDKFRLEHILEAIDRLETHAGNLSREELESDVLRYYGIVKNIEIIGEAANLLTKEFRSEHAEVPWRDMVDMRNLLIHGYITTNAAYIWDTYTDDLPVLRQQIEQYIAKMEA